MLCPPLCLRAGSRHAGLGRAATEALFSPQQFSSPPPSRPSFPLSRHSRLSRSPLRRGARGPAPPLPAGSARPPPRLLEPSATRPRLTSSPCARAARRGHGALLHQQVPPAPGAASPRPGPGPASPRGADPSGRCRAGRAGCA